METPSQGNEARWGTEQPGECNSREASREMGRMHILILKWKSAPWTTLAEPLVHSNAFI